jgi:serine phosphatase RsbU (regulator of sigma subunit)
LLVVRLSDKQVGVQERLEQFTALTDAELAYLGIEELLDELLDRVRELLDADTAAVLLLDEAGTHLVATAAAGLEEEVYQGFRAPVGRGFAGRVAAERRPVILEDVGKAHVLNPVLLDKGIRSMLGVPLIGQGTVIGVLHVGTLEPRRFTEEDADLLQLVADRVALASQAMVSNTERAAARLLQRSLLPTGLPDVPGVEMAARYVAGERGSVGGDWYDVFCLPDGRLCIAIGDIVGRGLRAAVVMGRVRCGLRAYALDSDDPAEVVTLLDEQLRHFEPEQMATLLYGIFDPSLERLTVSSAGHPPPILARPDAPATSLDIPADPPLGVDPPRPRRSLTVEVPPDSALCFYTDGLIERRDAPIDVGLDRLCATVGNGDPERECSLVMAGLVGTTVPADDIAILVVKRLAPAMDAAV